ncbi:MAG: PAS domain S-box protein [Alphaproteobacteria bacterium]|nr:PAS domain S-box protein [Alphaproteobacteria bacterium]
MTDPIRKSLSLAVLLALIYAVFGVLWVVSSDTILALMVSDPARMTLIQTWKGWLFVAISSGLILAVGNRLLRAVEESEGRYRLMFDGNPEAMLLYDPVTALVVEVNPAFGRLFGYGADEMRGTPVSTLLPLSERERFSREVERLRESSSDESIWQVVRKDGSLFEVASHGQGVFIKGRLLRLVRISDVTARLRSERELIRALGEVAAGNDRLRELGHAVSHDLQEPLRQVSSFVQLLDRRYSERLDDEARQFIAYAVEGVKRLKSLIGDFERFVEPASMIRQTVPVRTVVDQTIQDLRLLVDRAAAEIQIGDLPVILADPGKLAVIFHALLENALKFRAGDRPCRISVSAEQGEAEYIFRVTDNGIGVEAGLGEDIFALFRRLHTRDRIPGNGSGLALARKLTEALGGRIWADPAVGGGSVFSFTIPRVPA